MVGDEERMRDLAKVEDAVAERFELARKEDAANSINSVPNAGVGFGAGAGVAAGVGAGHPRARQREINVRSSDITQSFSQCINPGPIRNVKTHQHRYISNAPYVHRRFFEKENKAYVTSLMMTPQECDCGDTLFRLQSEIRTMDIFDNMI